jgi:transcriptional regulator with XRE-family HTH domain
VITQGSSPAGSISRPRPPSLPKDLAPLSTLALTTGADLKEARLSVGLSQEKLARLVGIGQPRLSAYETSRLNPSIETLSRIAAQIHVVMALRASQPGEQMEELVRLGAVKHLERASEALFAFLQEHGEYSDLVKPLMGLLGETRSRLDAD